MICDKDISNQEVFFGFSLTLMDHRKQTSEGKSNYKERLACHENQQDCKMVNR